MLLINFLALVCSCGTSSNHDTTGDREFCNNSKHHCHSTVIAWDKGVMCGVPLEILINTHNIQLCKKKKILLKGIDHTLLCVLVAFSQLPCD